MSSWCRGSNVWLYTQRMWVRFSRRNELLFVNVFISSLWYKVLYVGYSMKQQKINKLFHCCKFLLSTATYRRSLPQALPERGNVNIKYLFLLSENWTHKLLTLVPLRHGVFVLFLLFSSYNHLRHQYFNTSVLKDHSIYKSVTHNNNWMFRCYW